MLTDSQLDALKDLRRDVTDALEQVGNWRIAQGKDAQLVEQQHAIELIETAERNARFAMVERPDRIREKYLRTARLDLYSALVEAERGWVIDALDALQRAFDRISYHMHADAQRAREAKS